MAARNVRLDEAIGDYLAQRKVEGYAKNTLGNQRVILDRALKVIGNLLLHNISDTHVRDVLAAAAETRSPRSLNNDFACLRQFFTWCVDTRRMPKYAHPMAGMKPPRYTVEERRRVPVAQFPELMDSQKHPRNRMLIVLAIYLLARSVEITGIRLKDVRLDQRRIRITVAKKRGADVTTDDMAIPRRLAKELRVYLTWYAGQFPEMNPEWFLVPAIKGLRFVGKNKWEGGEMIPNRRFRRPSAVIVRALESIGFATRDEDGKSLNEGMHTLRRSAARAYFDSLVVNGYDGALRRVQIMLHHKNASMTEHYIGIDLDRQQRNADMEDGVMYAFEDENVIPLQRPRSALLLASNPL